MSRFDVVGGITGLIQGVLVTNVFVTTQGRAVVLTWASLGLDLAYSLLIGSVVVSGLVPSLVPPGRMQPDCSAGPQAAGLAPRSRSDA
ncbi:hypothetical protein ACFO1B_39845 [Dactylosporangium siamense]|uniref:hypothetical protein n=1 Tax=Dactylosporangium siamense TaxID=685454 RepID=UPI0019450586|nr:hypothetical protein [Dactylosporangium siamense]